MINMANPDRLRLKPNWADLLTPEPTLTLDDFRGPPRDAPHAWQEYNQYGNTCQYPGCRLAEEEH